MKTPEFVSTPIACVLLLFCQIPFSYGSNDEDWLPVNSTAKSPGGSTTVTCSDMSVVIKRNGEEIIRQDANSCEFFRACWSPDEKMLAVATGPIPRRYGFFVFDLANKNVVYSDADDTVSFDAHGPFATYFKKQVPSVFREDPDSVSAIACPVAWKDNKTLKLRVTLVKATVVYEVQPYIAYANARFSDNRCQLIGQPYGFKEQRD